MTKINKIIPKSGKRISLMILALLLLMTGCESSYKMLETSTPTSFNMNYAKFTGERKKSFQLKEGQTADVEIEVTTKEGALEMFITGENGEAPYEGHDIPSSSFTVHLDKADKYTVVVRGKSHKGGFRLKWVASQGK